MPKKSKFTDHIRGMERKKLLLSCIVVSVIAALTLLLVLLFISRTPPASPLPATIDITGIITCLPHKNTDGPQTLECAVGLRTPSGAHYALRNAPMSLSIDYANKPVRIKGNLITPAADERYDIIGTIDVTDVTSGN